MMIHPNKTVQYMENQQAPQLAGCVYRRKITCDESPIIMHINIFHYDVIVCFMFVSIVNIIFDDGAVYVNIAVSSFHVVCSFQRRNCRLSVKCAYVAPTCSESTHFNSTSYDWHFRPLGTLISRCFLLLHSYVTS